MPKYTIIDVEGRWEPKNEDEWLYWPRVLWIDPGVVSGVATFWFDPVALFAQKPMPRVLLAYSEIFLTGPESGANGQINRYIRMQRALDAEAGLATGIESFRLRSNNMDEELLAPVRIRAGIEYAFSMDERGEIPLFTQSPSDALQSFTNARLKELGLYTEGPDHKNDAKRHGLLWLRKLRAAGEEFFMAAHGNDPMWWEE